MQASNRSGTWIMAELWVNTTHKLLTNQSIGLIGVMSIYHLGEEKSLNLNLTMPFINVYSALCKGTR